MTKAKRAIYRDPKHSMHFVPGEIMLLIRHLPGILAKRITDILNERRDIEGHDIFNVAIPGLSLPPTPEPYFDHERVVTFDRSQFDNPDNPKIFSLVFASTPHPLGEHEFLRYIQALDVTSKGRILPDDLEIVAATPNWLSCGASENNGSGGPGARPVPAKADVANEPLPALGTVQEDFGACATVFILDTAPCEVDLMRAYRRWVENQPPDKINRRLKRLIGPDGALGFIDTGLRIEYAGHSHLLETANANIPDHNYVMADHGLFVASLINEYAPGARLHLVEVLNPYGVGTLESIAQGFLRAAQYAIDNSSKKVLVNVSLFLDVAQADEISFGLLAREDPFWEDYLNAYIELLEAKVKELEARALSNQEQQLLAELKAALSSKQLLLSNMITRTVKPLELVCDLLRRRNIPVAAAAGNDAGQHQTAGNNKRPKARFPAAYSSVLGVGARDKSGKTASYSNEPDQPPADGVEAFGGDVSSAGGGTPNRTVANETNGLLGVYIGSFPNRERNEQGLARWAGTSFATPLIIAWLAAMLCDSSSEQRQSDPLQRVKSAFKPASGSS